MDYKAFLADLWKYIQSFVCEGRNWVMGGALFMLIDIRNLFSCELLPRFFVWLVIALTLLGAGFSTWRKEHQERLEAQKKLDERTRKRNIALSLIPLLNDLTTLSNRLIQTRLIEKPQFDRWLITISDFCSRELDNAWLVRLLSTPHNWQTTVPLVWSTHSVEEVDLFNTVRRVRLNLESIILELSS